MELKRRIYGLPIMKFYRELRAAQLASKFAATQYGFRFAGNPVYLSDTWEPNEKRILGELLGESGLLFMPRSAGGGRRRCD